MTEFYSKTNRPFPLRMIAEGEKVKIVSLNGGRAFHDRLAGMGLNFGAELEVLQNQGSGRMVVAHGGARLFFGGGMAHKVQVIIVEGDLK